MKRKIAIIGLLLSCGSTLFGTSYRAKPDTRRKITLQNNTKSDIFVLEKRSLRNDKWFKIKPGKRETIIARHDEFRVANASTSRDSTINLLPGADTYGIYEKGNTAFKARGWKGRKKIGWTE